MSTFPASAAVGPSGVGLEWNDLSVILAICRQGSLSGAARALRVNHSTVFRRIVAIEERTGVRFFERLPHGYAMTDAGRSAMYYAERIEAEVHALGREVLGQDMRLQGKVRVTSPEGMAVRMMPSLLAAFAREHPGVSVELVGGSLAVDLSRREADIAIRATSKPPGSGFGRKIGAFRVGLYAAPEYARRHAAVPLGERDWCMILGSVAWLVPHVWKKRELGERRLVFSASSVISVINTTAEGVGMTMLPCYLGDADERLVRVGALVDELTMELWVLTHPDLRHTARVKTLMAFLYEAMMRERDLFAGERVAKPGEAKKSATKKSAAKKSATKKSAAKKSATKKKSAAKKKAGSKRAATRSAEVERGGKA